MSLIWNETKFRFPECWCWWLLPTGSDWNFCHPSWEGLTALAMEGPNWGCSLNPSVTHCTHREILLNQTKIRLYFPFSNWFGTTNGQCPSAVPNQTMHGKYNPISVWFNKNSKICLCVEALQEGGPQTFPPDAEGRGKSSRGGGRLISRANNTTLQKHQPPHLQLSESLASLGNHMRPIEDTAPPWNPSEHHCIIVLRGLRGAITPRDASLSRESLAKFRSLLVYTRARPLLQRWPHQQPWLENMPETGASRHHGGPQFEPHLRSSPSNLLIR